MREGCKKRFFNEGTKVQRVNKVSVDSSFIEVERSAVPSHTKREFSSAGLEHLPYKQRVGGSNPSTPTKQDHSIRVVFSFVFVDGFVSRWRLGRLICVRLLFAVANLCLSLIIVFENKFSAIISQSQQSSIATAPLRSPLNCCDRSNRLWKGGRSWNKGINGIKGIKGI